MPFVDGRVAGGLSREQKQELIAGITDLLGKVADKPAGLCHVTITEVERENWGWKGRPLS